MKGRTPQVNKQYMYMTVATKPRNLQDTLTARYGLPVGMSFHVNAAADPGVGSVYTLHAVVRHCNVRVGPRTLLYCTISYFTFATTCSTITYFGPSAERVFIIMIVSGSLFN